MDRYLVSLSCKDCSTGTDFEASNDEKAIQEFDTLIAGLNKQEPFIVEADLLNTRTMKTIKSFHLNTRV